MNFKELYNKEYFDGTKSQYGGHYDGNQKELDWRLKLLDNFDFKSFLEIGCANGYFVDALNKKGKEAKGFDISEYIVKRDGIKNIEVGDALEFPFRECFDLIFSADLMEHLDLKRIDKCCEQCRGLATKYIVHIISTAYDKDIGDGREIVGMDKGHISMFTVGWWIKKFQQHFENWNLKIDMGLNFIVYGGEKFNTTIFILKR